MSCNKCSKTGDDCVRAWTYGHCDNKSEYPMASERVVTDDNKVISLDDYDRLQDERRNENV